MENHTHDPSHQSSHHAKRNVPMAVLSYIGPLVIVSYVMAKEDPFVKFHIKQGLVLLVIEVAIWILAMLFWPLWFIFQIVNLLVFILVIIGIINAVNGREKELPVVGKYAKHFPKV